MLKIPKSFAELQALNVLLKKYRDIYPYRIVICYVITYFLCVPFLSYCRCTGVPRCFEHDFCATLRAIGPVG